MLRVDRQAATWQDRFANATKWRNPTVIERKLIEQLYRARRSATAHLHGCRKHAAVRDCITEAVGDPCPPRWSTPSLRRTLRVSLLFTPRLLNSGWRQASTTQHPSLLNVRLLLLLLLLLDQRLSRSISRTAEPQLKRRHGIVVGPGARCRRRHSSS